MPVYFEGTQVSFSEKKRVGFCDKCGCDSRNDVPTPCTLPAGTDMPSCVVLARSDFFPCAICDEFIDDGIMPIQCDWQGTQFDSSGLYMTTDGNKLYASVSHDTVGCKWDVVIQCKDGASYEVVWAGEKDYGQLPTGVYQRTAGCDTVEQLLVF